MPDIIWHIQKASNSALSNFVEPILCHPLNDIRNCLNGAPPKKVKNACIIFLPSGNPYVIRNLKAHKPVRKPKFPISCEGNGFELLVKLVGVLWRRCCHYVSDARLGLLMEIEPIGHLVVVRDSEFCDGSRLANVKEHATKRKKNRLNFCQTISLIFSKAWR